MACMVRAADENMVAYQHATSLITRAFNSSVVVHDIRHRYFVFLVTKYYHCHILLGTRYVGYINWTTRSNVHA